MKTSMYFIAAVLHILMPPGPKTDSSILYLTGASAMEELSESEYERFDRLSQHPLDINGASRSRLLSCGLFNQFQVASLLDYRMSSGDIMSLDELALMDGFGEDFVRALSPFITVASRSVPGKVSEKGQRHLDVQLKSGLSQKVPDSPGISWGAKLRYEGGGVFSASAACKKDYFSPCLTFYGKRWLGKVVLGDFNARFGQGLLLWSGFSLSSLSSVQAFYRRPSGISPSWTFTSPFRGIAADFNTGGRGVISLLFSQGEKEIIPVTAVNYSFFGSRGQWGISARCDLSGAAAFGADARWNLGRVDIFGEAVCSFRERLPSAVLGGVWNMARDFKLVTRAYYAAGDCVSLSYGMQLRRMMTSLDMSYDIPEESMQYKLIGTDSFALSPSLGLSTRVAIRLKPGVPRGTKGEFRGVLTMAKGEWNASLRMDASYCLSFGALTYAEVGRKSGKSSLWLRTTLFCIDNWDDRIYVYERDAPGSFNVPAYCGRGAAISGYLSLKSGRSSWYLRLSSVTYFGSKPWKWDVHLQYRLSV